MTTIRDLEDDTTSEPLGTTDGTADEATMVGVELLFDGCRLGPADPGCWKPGIPPDVGTGASLATSVGEATVDVSFSAGEYVNLGICRLVPLVVLFSTALTVLDNADEVTEGVGNGLSPVGACLGSGVVADVDSTLDDLSDVGFGVGVMKDVEKTVCGS